MTLSVASSSSYSQASTAEDATAISQASTARSGSLHSNSSKSTVPSRNNSSIDSGSSGVIPPNNTKNNQQRNNHNGSWNSGASSSSSRGSRRVSSATSYSSQRSRSSQSSQSSHSSSSHSSSFSSRTSATSNSSRKNHPNKNSGNNGKKGRLSTIHSVSSHDSDDQVSSSQASSAGPSAYTSGFSLPSSFGGSAYNKNTNHELVTTLQRHEDSQEDTITNSNSSCTDVTSVNTETRLAIQVEKETRPMMHLVQLLKEMELDSNNTNNNDDDPQQQRERSNKEEGHRKTKAIASLIEEFTEEVQLIERRIVHPELMNGDDDDDDDENSLLLQDVTETLPKDWVALLDPDSGDVYYSNEVTGETTWDKPENPKQLMNDSVSDDIHHPEEEDNAQLDEEEDDEEEEELPPDWVALEDLDSGDVYYANEVTGETTWDRPIMTEEEKHALQQQHQQPSVQAQVSSNNNDVISSNNNLNHQESLTEHDIMNGVVGNDDEISADDSLPRDWIPLVDPDSGDTYYCNEVTGETTWDKPQFSRQDDDEEDNSEVTPSESDNEQSLLELDEAAGDDSVVEVEESHLIEDKERLEDLPHGWFSIVDPDSGDVYYSNDITGETTWEKPVIDYASISPEKSTQLVPQDQKKSNNPESNGDNDLPHGWIASVDPVSGDEYYFNEGTGETTWDKPLAHQIDEQQQEHINTSSDLAIDWFPATDPNSGETYYVNERTGETSWDKPEALQQLDNSPHDVTDEIKMLTNGPSQNLPPGWFAATDAHSGDEYYVNEHTGETTWDRPEDDSTHPPPNPVSEEEGSLASGWFPVVEPGSGDTYYANEQTGETSWEKPISLKALDCEHSANVDQSPHGMSRMSLSMHDNTVFEDDSVTSSQY